MRRRLWCAGAWGNRRIFLAVLGRAQAHGARGLRPLVLPRDIFEEKKQGVFVRCLRLGFCPIGW